MSSTHKKLRMFAYCRESVNLDSGIQIQKEKITKYSNAYDIEIVKWFIENDASAFKPRSKYDKMISEMFEDDSIDGVICSSLTRFGRRASVLIPLNERMNDAQKRLIMVDNNIDSRTINGKAMLGMMAIFAQLERDTTNQRTADGRERAKRVGTKSGLPMHRPRIEVDWKEYDRFHKLGLSNEAISKVLTDKRTGKRISGTALRKAVREREN